MLLKDVSVESKGTDEEDGYLFISFRFLSGKSSFCPRQV